MVKHKKIYINYLGYCEQDFIPCEVCGALAVDVHHILFKSQGGKDEIKNLIGLCRSCHSMAHYLGGLKSLKLTRECLRTIHNNFLSMKNRNC